MLVSAREQGAFLFKMFVPSSFHPGFYFLVCRLLGREASSADHMPQKHLPVRHLAPLSFTLVWDAMRFVFGVIALNTQRNLHGVVSSLAGKIFVAVGCVRRLVSARAQTETKIYQYLVAG